MLLTQHRADRVLLHHLTWQQFETLLTCLGDQRNSRIAYDAGTVEIMTPLPEHEYYRDAIADTIKDIADELDLDYECYGSTTWRKPLKQAGVEADNCFYFQNEHLIRGKLNFDLSQDPPPDLALEIDLTSKSLARFPIYARLNVPEIWCYEAGELRIYTLQNGQYQDVDTSPTFPQLKIRELPQLIETHRMQGRRALRRAVRNWTRAQIQP
ncbi:Uma2 family endonuclease [Spirulina major CS-329]|uniref:Uma2 family endonuclease n=1 Tax=Spirulina TaxID=1154 RepID=UPI00232E520F|nr:MULTISPECIES: Uma2 family endonuclease [Spirulina]MDB9493465.1 Uma2 family endonuclease [Spirulina subsalsa CS-330]MDB9505214.1 Uma2 family endonuclease [Spirulina major CS-329]